MTGCDEQPAKEKIWQYLNFNSNILRENLIYYIHRLNPMDE